MNSADHFPKTSVLLLWQQVWADRFRNDWWTRYLACTRELPDGDDYKPTDTLPPFRLTGQAKIPHGGARLLAHFVNLYLPCPMGPARARSSRPQERSAPAAHNRL